MKDLKIAIAKVMTNDTEYLALMGAPADPPYQTFFLKPPEVPTFPETVFDFGSVVYDRGNDREMMAADIILNIRVWTDDDTYEDIVDRIKVLFHQKSIGTTGAHAILAGEPQDLKDEEFNVYGKMMVFAVYHRRTIYE